MPAYLSSGIFCAVLSTLYAVAVDMSNPFDMCVRPKHLAETVWLAWSSALLRLLG